VCVFVVVVLACRVYEVLRPCPTVSLQPWTLLFCFLLEYVEFLISDVLLFCIKTSTNFASTMSKLPFRLRGTPQKSIPNRRAVFCRPAKTPDAAVRRAFSRAALRYSHRPETPPLPPRPLPRFYSTTATRAIGATPPAPPQTIPSASTPWPP
jgi:hypothetical protein